MLTPSIVRGVVLGGILAGFVVACDDKPPTAPTSTSPPTPPAPTLTRVEIVGPRSVAPGETVQFGVRGTLSDGSTQDMTSQATWQSQHGVVLSVDSTGMATGQDLGETILTARVTSRSATAEIVVVPAGTFRLSVFAREGGSSATGVRVDVVSGRGTGLFDETPDNGRYDIYGVEGDTQIRVSGSGYVEHVQQVIVSAHMVVDVDLSPARPRPIPGGTYTLTITADPACRDALAEGLRSRRYGAQVNQLGSEVAVVLERADFRYARGDIRNRFSGRVDGTGSKVAFSLAANVGYYGPLPDVSEWLGGSRYLVFSGEAATSVSPAGFSGTLNGAIEVWEVSYYTSARLATCHSTQHSFVFSR